MTPRCLLISLLSVGCAAAVPAAHGLFGGGGHDGDHASMFAKFHGAHRGAAHARGSHVADAHGPAEIRARITEALDSLGLEPDTRAKTDAILEPSIGEVVALVAKVESGEIDPDAAFAEHEKIVTTARADLAAALTPEQIEKFFGALFGQGEECPLQK